MTKRVTRPAQTVPIPQNREEADTAIAAIGAAQRGIALQQAALDAVVAAAKEDAEAAIVPLKAIIEARTRGLQIWAEANREALTGGRTKTVTLPAGTLSWRLRPLSVRLAGVPDVVAALVERGLEQFLRRKLEVDREAMLRDPALAGTVMGVSIASEGEDFVVDPVALPLAAE